MEQTILFQPLYAGLKKKIRHEFRLILVKPLGLICFDFLFLFKMILTSDFLPNQDGMNLQL